EEPEHLQVVVGRVPCRDAFARRERAVTEEIHYEPRRERLLASPTRPEVATATRPEVATVSTRDARATKTRERNRKLLEQRRRRILGRIAYEPGPERDQPMISATNVH